MNRLMKQLNIAVVNHPANSVIISEVSLPDFIQILEPLSSQIYVITDRFLGETSPKIHLVKTTAGNKEGESRLTQGIKYFPRLLLAQMKVSFHLFKISRNVEVVIFYVGCTLDFLPVFWAKLLRKRTIIISAGSPPREARVALPGFWGTLASYPLAILERITFSLVDQIAVESESVIRFYNLVRYRKKLSVSGVRYMDTSFFTVKSSLGLRKDIVGYVGQLNVRKGVMNFVKAIPLISREYNHIRFLIIGQGELLNDIRREIKRNGLEDKVTITGWIPRSEFPGYLNQLKLLILPSRNEGLPGIIQEAMACGTPVLATPVGGIPDLIKDSQTGFLMEDNSPQSIAQNVIRALNHPNLEQITQNAHRLIEEQYTYEPMVEKWRVGLQRLTGGR